MIKPNPFTPKAGMEPREFVGREKEIETFQKRLEEARRGRCDHFLILGNWGMGKTTLLKEFKKIAQEQKILASLVSIDQYTTSNTRLDGIKQLMSDIPRKLPIELSRLKRYMTYIAGLGIQVMGTGFSFSRKIERMQPQPLFFDSLITLWKDLKKKSEVVVVLLDDVQNFSPISEIFTTLKNVLSDEEIINSTKFLFVLSCTPDKWRQFLQKHHPIGRYFTPRLSLTRLSKKKTDEALSRILKGTGVIFNKEIKQLVYEYTMGHLYELQVMGSNLYENQIGEQVTKEIWDTSLKSTLLELGETVFDALYEKASPQERKVLYLSGAFAKAFTLKEIVQLSRKTTFNLAENTIKTSLSRLYRKGLLTKPDKFKYLVPDKIFKEYILCIRGYDGEGSIIPKVGSLVQKFHK